MRKVRGKLCRTGKGRFARCRSAGGGGGRSKRSCKYGVSKTTGRCLKRPRSCR
jgi:hypothetical protein